MLVQWVLEMRKDGVPVTHSMLQIMAMEAAIDEGYSEDKFRAGWHWLAGFKRRHKFSLRARTRVAQDTQGCGIAMRQAFAERVRALKKEHDVDVVYNADQNSSEL